jgi:anaerobic magnesium-protoporphyrin IX monomethyl ester cyclase
MSHGSVLFVNPGWPGRVSRKGKRFNRAWPPLSLMTCAAMLMEKGFEARIIDGRVQPEWQSEAVRFAGDVDWVVLTSSPLDRWQCPNLEANRFIEIARSFPPEKLIVVGAHGSSRPRAMLKESGAQAVVVGEPEEVLVRLVSEDDWDSITGVACTVNGLERLYGKAEPVDMARLPLPAFELVDFSQYHYELLGDRFSLFETSRGCPFQCRFCLKVMFGGPVRFKPVARVMDEVHRAVTGFDVRSAYFIDLEFTLNRDHTAAICDALIEASYPLAWCCQTRADAVDPDLLNRMKKAGCRLIHFGVESGSGPVLRATGKKIDPAAIERGVRMTQKAGIETACFFMFGFPGETQDDMEKTAAFARKLNPTYASFHVATPYPGTALFEDSGCVSSPGEDCLEIPAHCEGHDPVLLDSITRRAFKNFYLRPRYVASRILQGNARSWMRQLRLFRGFAS